jgi:predicted amidohydrolase YtcJ
MTLWNAYAAFEEAEVGSISVGKRADMTITDQNLMTIDEAGILATKPIMTIVGGEVVFSSM